MKISERKRVRKNFMQPSLTKQSFQKECNINNLMAKYQKTGLHAHVNRHQGNYGDFMQATDYHTAMNQIIAAGDAFNTVPAEIRAKFENDPGKFLEFCQNTDNLDEMREIGLLPAKRQQDPSTLDPVPTPPEDLQSVIEEALASHTKQAAKPAEQPS